MFQFSYTPYLSASFRHPYYSDGVTDDFQFVPTRRTQEFLDSFGLRCRNTAGKLFVYQQRDESGLPFQEIDAVTDLYFIITPTSDILNITQRFGSGKYFFSNLRPDGTYNTILTIGPKLSLSDQMPAIMGQQSVIEFVPDTLTKVVISQIAGGTGWQKIKEYAIAPTDSMVAITLNNPGRYQIEKFKKGGGTDTSVVFMDDELKRSINTWGVLHLQLKPGDVPTDYTADLPAAANFWQYFIVEPTGRTGGVLTPSKLAVKCMVTGSRYPATLKLLLQDPATYPAPVKDRINALKSLPRTRDVYLFQSNEPVSIMDGEQPKLKLLYDTDELAGKMATPTRDRTDTSLIYKL